MHANTPRLRLRRFARCRLGRLCGDQRRRRSDALHRRRRAGVARRRLARHGRIPRPLGACAATACGRSNTATAACCSAGSATSTRPAGPASNSAGCSAANIGATAMRARPPRWRCATPSRCCSASRVISLIRPANQRSIAVARAHRRNAALARSQLLGGEALVYEAGGDERREHLGPRARRPTHQRPHASEPDNPRHEPAARQAASLPFERLALTRDITPPRRLPRHQPGHRRAAASDAGADRRGAGRQRCRRLARYPATAGEPALREACAGWLQRRYGVGARCAARQVLPVNGSREALFALAQTVIDPTRARRRRGLPEPVLPDLRRRGAAGRRRSRTTPTATRRATSPPTGRRVDAPTWARTQLLYVCSPGNPTGAVMPLDEWQQLFELSDRHGFVIASDECYQRDLLRRRSRRWARCRRRRRWAATTSATWWRFTSLSKRSNVPGPALRLRRRRRAR